VSEKPARSHAERRRRKATAEPTLTEALRARGYGHRATPHSPTSGKHEIYRLDTGDIVGQMTAAAAWDWLHQTEEVKRAG
jgi:hypothetical protein